MKKKVLVVIFKVRLPSLILYTQKQPFQCNGSVGVVSLWRSPSPVAETSPEPRSSASSTLKFTPTLIHSFRLDTSISHKRNLNFFFFLRRAMITFLFVGKKLIYYAEKAGTK